MVNGTFQTKGQAWNLHILPPYFLIAGEFMTYDFMIFDAMMFARDVRKNQVRKYTGAPYIEHLAEVAGIVASARGATTAMIATAWLHDCIEDQGVTHETLVKTFGAEIAGGVLRLSDLETGNRAERKQASCDRLAASAGWVQTIKCADLISNTPSIAKHDPKFATVYLEEKRLLLANSLTKADPKLRALALSVWLEALE